MVTIGSSESELELALGHILPGYLPQTEGYSPEIEIYENGRKKRRDASRDSWRPGSGEIRIKFGGAKTKPQSATDTEPNELTSVPSIPEAPVPESFGTLVEHISDLIKSLESAEQRPGFDFVALTWFRDKVLPAEGHGWAETPSGRDEVLRAAIKDGAVLTSKVPNPKAPLFPVMAIRLNRQHTDVVGLVGGPGVSASNFQPVSIRGEALSETVLRERR